MSEPYKFTIVVAIRIDHPIFEIYLDNLQYCLESVSNLQLGTVLHMRLIKEVIVIDYGSLDKYSKQISTLIKQYGYYYIKRNASAWSRSRALNIGIEYAKGNRIFIIDSDTVLPNNYIRAHLRQSFANTYTVSLVHDLAKDVKKSSNANELIKQSGKIRPMGWSHIGARRTWLVANGGYNEKYIGWGGEDDDIILRMELDGFKRRKIAVHPVHLYHPNYGDLLARVGKKDWYKKTLAENRTRYRAFRKRVK